jgi:hypothetical protein
MHFNCRLKIKAMWRKAKFWLYVVAIVLRANCQFSRSHFHSGEMGCLTLHSVVALSDWFERVSHCITSGYKYVVYSESSNCHLFFDFIVDLKSRSVLHLLESFAVYFRVLLLCILRCDHLCCLFSWGLQVSSYGFKLWSVCNTWSKVWLQLVPQSVLQLARRMQFWVVDDGSWYLSQPTDFISRFCCLSNVINRF